MILFCNAVMLFQILRFAQDDTGNAQDDSVKALKNPEMIGADTQNKMLVSFIRTIPLVPGSYRLGLSARGLVTRADLNRAILYRQWGLSPRPETDFNIIFLFSDPQYKAYNGRTAEQKY